MRQKGDEKEEHLSADDVMSRVHRKVQAFIENARSKELMKAEVSI